MPLKDRPAEPPRAHPAPDLKLFRRGGAHPAPVGWQPAELQSKISTTIRERFRIFRQLKVHTAQAKLTGIILMCLPP
jgi:Flp pilus assembly protein TadB